MKNILIVGGASGIGLSIADVLSQRNDVEKIYIVDKNPPKEDLKSKKAESFIFDLNEEDYSFFDRFDDADALIITAGFAKLALFKDLDDEYIKNSFTVNSIAPIKIIKHFYNKLLSDKDFFCLVMVSIAGFMTSPFYSVYGATKAALKIFIESVNTELCKSGSTNRILNVSPGSIKGTSFNGEKTDLTATRQLAEDIIQHLEQKDDLFIPQYEEVFKQVLERYREDFRKEGLHSYDYKLNSGRIK
ncbi:MAG: SDR family oxidoreductase [Bacteroidales bacterium]|nr:SDR family oxidoreductase [Bacteroidales bacterium]